MNAHPAAERVGLDAPAPPAAARPPASPHDPRSVLALQRSAGNAAVAGLLAARGPVVQARGAAFERPFELATGGAGRPLDRVAQARLEGALGQDLSDVRVHEDGEAERAGAHALASGSDVHIARGRYEPASPEGFDLLAHEIGHVAQQRAGRVPDGSGGRLLRDPALEAEADAFAAHATTVEPALAPARPAARRAARRVAQPAGPAIIAGAGALLALDAAAWELAGTVVGTLGATTGLVAGSYIGAQPGASEFASLILPGKVISGQDQKNLLQIAQFDIINNYVDLYLKRQQRGSGEPQETPEADKEGAGDAEREAIDEEVLGQVKFIVEASLDTLLETGLKTEHMEYKWGENDSRDWSSTLGGTDAPERVGVTGYLQLRDIEGVAVTRTLELTPDARTLVGDVPGEGTTLTAHRFWGGRVGGKVQTSAFQSLTVDVEGGGAQESMAEAGSPRFIVRTRWQWQRWGFDNTTWMQTSIWLDETGTPKFGSEWEGSPDNWPWEDVRGPDAGP